MAEFPALPFWIDAYLADCSHLSDAEHGRYLMMLFHMWRMPGVKFPNDDAWLARKFGRSLEVFVSEWKPLMQEFMHTDGNWYMQKRMQKVHAHVAALRAKNRDAAKARWDNEKDPCKRNASKTKSKTKTILKTQPANAGPVREEFELFWKAYRPPRNSKKPDAMKAWTQTVPVRPPLAELLRAVNGYASWLSEEGRKQKREYPKQMAATWLRGEMWGNFLDGGDALSPEQIAINRDRADQMMKRGKYKVDYS